MIQFINKSHTLEEPSDPNLPEILTVSLVELRTVNNNVLRFYTERIR